MKTGILFGATMLVVGTSVLQAYDLTAPYTGPAPPAVTPEWTWNGFYVAPFSGAGWGKNVWSNFDALSRSVTSGAFGSYSADSFSSGTKIGSSWQVGRFSFGAEVGTGGIGSGFCFECGSKTIGTVTGRAGVTINNTQFYLEGSRGWAQ
jgi:hypothetical protein